LQIPSPAGYRQARLAWIRAFRSFALIRRFCLILARRLALLRFTFRSKSFDVPGDEVGALQFAEDRVDVEDSAFGFPFFGADFFATREFDADFVFRVDIGFEVGARDVADLACVGRTQFPFVLVVKSCDTLHN